MSAEAEFFGTMLAAKEVIFIRELLIDLAFIIDAASVIKCDSKSAVGMAFDPVAFKKTSTFCALPSSSATSSRAKWCLSSTSPAS